MHNKFNSFCVNCCWQGDQMTLIEIEGQLCCPECNDTVWLDMMCSKCGYEPDNLKMKIEDYSPICPKCGGNIYPNDYDPSL